MSWTMDIFFNCRVEFDEIRTELEDWLRISFVRSEDGSAFQYESLVSALRILLFEEHHFYDEERLPYRFSHYQYWLRISRIYSKPNAIEYARSTCIYWSQLLHQKLEWELIALDDLEGLIYSSNPSLKSFNDNA